MLAGYQSLQHGTTGTKLRTEWRESYFRALLDLEEEDEPQVLGQERSWPQRNDGALKCVN
jgi:hypothetical protein